MATITNTSAFSSDNFWAALQGAPIQATATTYRFQNAAGLFVEVIGSGMTYAGNAPSGGTYTAIRVYTTNAFANPISTYTSATGIAFATYFSSGAATALAGLDSLVGSTGNDILNGRAGNDTISGGTGADQAFGDAGNDVFQLIAGDNAAGERFDGGADTDRIAISGAGFFDFSDDIVTSIEELTLQAGGTARFSIAQGAANPIVAVSGDGGANVVQFFGASGLFNLDLSNWTFTGWNQPSDGIIVQASIVGAFNDVFVGSAQRDVVHSEFGNDSLTGGGGNDHLNGGAGNDTLNGGLGDDEFVIDSVNDIIVEAAGQGIDVIFSPITYTLTQANVEELYLWGNLQIDGTGNALRPTRSPATISPTASSVSAATTR